MIRLCFPRRIAALACACLFLVSACGEDEAAPRTSPSPSAISDSFPVTIEAPNGDVSIEARPEAIVSLSPTGTEMLFAIDAGDQVIAVDDQSTFPAEAPMTDLSGFEPNIEAIAAYEPDLVVISGDPSDVVKSLEKLDIPVLLQPAAASLEDTYSQINDLGSATGRSAEAEELVSSMQSDIESIVASAPELTRAPTYFHELDDTYFTITSETFIGQVYSLLGLKNIADEAKGAGSGYPQLSSEYIVDADPDIIFLADTKCCGQSLETVEKRPGWDQTTAVKTGSVVELDDDVASRWGPRVVDFLNVVADALEAVESES